MNRDEDAPVIEPLAGGDDFPCTAQFAYLNSAGIGLVPSPVFDEVERFTRDLATRGTVAYFESVARFRDAPRHAGARLFGTEPEHIALVTTASEAMCQLALTLRPGSRANVVTIDTESAAVSLPWIRVAEDTGLDVRIVDTSPDPSDLKIEHIAELVDDDTAVVAVSQVEWVTGHRFDLAALADLAHAHGAIAAVDCYQAAGVVPIDVTASGVDMAVAGSFKWLCGLAAAAICYLRPELSEQIRPALVGSTTSDSSFDRIDGTALAYASGARRLEYGSCSPIARLSMGLSMEYLMDIGTERIFEHVVALNDRLADGVESLGGRVITPRDRSRRAGILSVEFAGTDCVAIAAELERAGVICSPRRGLVRFSPHLFNSSDDIDRALNALEGTALALSRNS